MPPHCRIKPQPRIDREEFDQRGERMLDDVEAAALGVGIVRVDAGADDDLALVGLAAIGVHRVRHDHARHDRLDRLGDQRLQRMALDRQAHTKHRGDDAGVAGGHARDFWRADFAASWSSRR